MTAKKGTLGPVGLKKEKTNYTNLPLQWGKLTFNWKTATLFHRTEKLHKTTEKKTKTKQTNKQTNKTKTKQHKNKTKQKQKHNQRFEEIQLIFSRDKKINTWYLVLKKMVVMENAHNLRNELLFDNFTFCSVKSPIELLKDRFLKKML